MKIGDLVKIEGGTLRPSWYGEVGIIISLDVPEAYKNDDHSWYEVSLSSTSSKFIRSDMIKVPNEAR